MNKKETAGILTILKVSYPFFYKNINEQDIIDTVNVWTTMFADDDVRIVIEATKALIMTHKDYPPTIAHIKEKIELLTKQPVMSEMEAWSIVLKAIKDSYYNAQTHFDNFPPTIQQTIRIPSQLREWGQMESEVVNSVVASNFMRSYKANVQHAQQIERLPESTKTMIEGLKNKFLLEA